MYPKPYSVYLRGIMTPSEVSSLGDLFCRYFWGSDSAITTKCFPKSGAHLNAGPGTAPVCEKKQTLQAFAKILAPYLYLKPILVSTISGLHPKKELRRNLLAEYCLLRGEPIYIRRHIYIYVYIHIYSFGV